jgi:hypothetical protein
MTEAWASKQAPRPPRQLDAAVRRLQTLGEQARCAELLGLLNETGKESIEGSGEDDDG